MAGRVDFDLKVAGITELIAGLETLQGPELRKVITDSLSRTARGVVVPAMRRQMASDFKRTGSHKDRKGVSPKRGQGGPAESNVTVRSTRKRHGELVALGVGPRAWYGHFPIGGTKPHVISATGRGPFGRQAPSSVVRSINREYTGRTTRSSGALTRTGRALYIQGYYRERVQHPGSRGTDSITRAVRGITDQLDARYGADLQKAYDKHLVGPTRRAKPRTP